MIPFRGFAYVQARLQARVGELLSEQQWMQLSAARCLSAYLEEARTTALQSWVSSFSIASDSHDIERGIRAQLRATVAEVARWTPEDWRSAVTWVYWLPSLPLLQRLLQGGALSSWVAKDPVFVRYVDAKGGVALPAIERDGGSPLLEAWSRGERLDSAWNVHWQALWPRCNRRVEKNLHALARLVEQHWRTFSLLSPDQTWIARRALLERLQHLFHRYLLQPAGLFTYLCLVVCDLERLRGALVYRALFTEGAEVRC